MKRRAVATMTVATMTAATCVSLIAWGVTPSFAATSATSSTNYIVQPGDTLYKISVKLQINLTALEQANQQIQNLTYIYPGEVIHLPTEKYTVRSGDTMYKISVAQGVPLSKLEKANPQMTDFTNISPGEVINLPLTALTTSPADGQSSSSQTSPSIPTSPLGTTTVSSTSSSSTHVSSPASAPASSSSTLTGNQIVTYAKSLIGVPYTWGGTTPATGFDCSGFVLYVFEHFGIALPRESHSQAEIGTSVAQNALQPGDILFFQNTDSYASQYANHVTHDGIYIGNGDMIESTSVNGKGVTVVQNVFSNPFYVAHYYGARNVIQ